VLASAAQIGSYEIFFQAGPEGSGPSPHNHPWDEASRSAHVYQPHPGRRSQPGRGACSSRTHQLEWLRMQCLGCFEMYYWVSKCIRQSSTRSRNGIGELTLSLPLMRDVPIVIINSARISNRPGSRGTAALIAKNSFSFNRLSSQAMRDE
jgi:hypothetical protein